MSCFLSNHIMPSDDGNDHYVILFMIPCHVYLPWNTVWCYSWLLCDAISHTVSCCCSYHVISSDAINDHYVMLFIIPCHVFCISHVIPSDTENDCHVMLFIIHLVSCDITYLIICWPKKIWWISFFIISLFLPYCKWNQRLYSLFLLEGGGSVGGMVTQNLIT